MDILEAIFFTVVAGIIIFIGLFIFVMVSCSLANFAVDHRCNQLVEKGVYEDFKTCYLEK